MSLKLDHAPLQVYDECLQEVVSVCMHVHTSADGLLAELVTVTASFLAN